MMLSSFACFSASYLAAISAILLVAVPDGEFVLPPIGSLAIFCLVAEKPLFTATPGSYIIFSPTSAFSGMTNASHCSSWPPPLALVGLFGPSRALSVGNASSDASPVVIFAVDDIAAPLLLSSFDCRDIFTYSND
jgi:hypothetical protein